MKHGIFILFALVAFCAADNTTEVDELLSDYTKVMGNLQQILPTLDTGGQDALDNLKSLGRIMAMIKTQFEASKDQLPSLNYDPIERLTQTIEKINSLVEARETLLANPNTEKEPEKEKEKEKEPEKEEPKIACTSGACCNQKTGFVKPRGTGCDVVDECQEPASLCSGEEATCETVAKPNGTICGNGMACYSGSCQRNKKEIKAEREAKLIAKKEAELIRKKATHRLLKEKRKQEMKKEKDKEIKGMLKRFAVFSFLNNKADSWEADITAGDYVAGLPNAPKHEDIFKHQYVGSKNALFNNIGNFAQQSTVVSSSETQETSSAALLKSGNGPSATSTTVVGVVLIAVALLIIIAYFVFGGKKKAPQPRTVY